MSGYWPAWASGLALSAIAVGYFRTLGKTMGVSGTFERAFTFREERAKRDRLPVTGELAFLAMLAVGAFVAALLRGAFAVRFDLGSEFARYVGSGPRAWAALFGGGVLVGFGTRLAGGCTSGHGLAGCARGQRGSLVATACFFGTAVVVSLVLGRLS